MCFYIFIYFSLFFFRRLAAILQQTAEGAWGKDPKNLRRSAEISYVELTL